AFETGQHAIATRIHLELLPLFKALFVTANPIPVKAALRLQGWQVGSTRLPLVDSTTELTETLASVMAELALI
ncbi:MAG TPA: dihydrodipicolinate synthase family protein, partial [Candidatus Sericytochromatia bacterium]